MIALGDATLNPYAPILFQPRTDRNLFWGSGDGELNFSTGQLEFGRTANFANSDPLLKTCRQSTRQRHGGRFDLGFADGHIENMKAERLFSRRPEVRKLWNNDNEPHPELP